MTTEITETPTDMRRCIGSTRFGIEAHESPENEFPVQPSAKDGLGRMCHTHWRQYTNALRKAAVARKAEEPTAEDEVAPEPAPELVAEPEIPAPRWTRHAKAQAEPEAEIAAG